ncbi:MAG: hypothetical protein WC438_05815 [Candidatus Pacearchaeota archaeon]|jgi:sugar-specific transcriptional regulator TrmB
MKRYVEEKNSDLLKRFNKSQINEIRNNMQQLWYGAVGLIENRNEAKTVFTDVIEELMYEVMMRIRR